MSPAGILAKISYVIRMAPKFLQYRISFSTKTTIRTKGATLFLDNRFTTMIIIPIHEKMNKKSHMFDLEKYTYSVLIKCTKVVSLE